MPPPDLTALDANALQDFLDMKVAPFIGELEKIRKDSDSGDALHTMLGDVHTTSEANIQQDTFLGIGGMATDSETGGGGLIKSVKEQATSIDGIFEFQQRLFDDLDNNLQETINTLLRDQGTSLAAIEGQEFLDIFGEVEDTMTGADEAGSGETGSG
ncbi:type VII secretion system-associated protein [Streptomyces xantholiticus]|uniref:type VII secretion system-associated protein n=1 Tax=Streptomyces xantholiticus TaxID=68285 RepID=UPI001678D455|nr:type VII secretion system-associated protein [Streptomyces xantholiticus]GGW30771.1 hypothetical protein GCM10010381_14080 [Streptomyces xantholiticus]